MRFLTRELHSGLKSDRAAKLVAQEYRRHLARLLPRIPQAFREIAQDISIHDGLILGVWIDTTARELRLALRCGDLAIGYFDLDLTYQGVRVDLLDRAVLQVIARDPKTEVLYDEVDVLDDGVFVHRVLFWPYYREIHVVFTGLSIARTSRPDRRVDAMSDRYAET